MSIHIHIDIDECATDNGGCEQICINNVGSYECSCTAGYTMKSDGYNCAGTVLCVCKMDEHAFVCLLLVPYCLRFCHEYNIVSSSDNSH